jgi:flagellar basal-body rod modification protein FlgD
MSSVSAVSQSSSAASVTPATTQIGALAGQTQENQFLTLLTTELQNQDPTQPTDPTQFVTQLAQFSTVEQLTQSNTTLTSISSSLNGMALGQYSGLINNTVTATPSTLTVPTSGSVSVPLTYNITNAALTNPYIAVTNASGNLVASLPVSGTTGSVTFDGTDGQGNTLPAGQYSVALVGTPAGQTSGSTSSAGTLTTTDVVASVTQGATGSWNLQLQNGQTVAANGVTSAN